MHRIFEPFVWHPPAETKLKWSAIYKSISDRSEDFKSDLCKYLHLNSCILGGSARALLYKLLKQLKEAAASQRNEVLIPGYTCYSVAAAVAKANLKITVYDLDPDTLDADMGSLERMVSDKTLAVVVQHLFGMPSPMNEAKKIAQKHGVFLIEDAAQAFGDVAVGNIPGTIGDFGLFSFGRGKPLPVGGGGALVTRKHSKIINEITFNKSDNDYKSIAVSFAINILSKPAFYWIPEMLPIGLGKTVYDPSFAAKGISKATDSILAKSLSRLSHLNAHRIRLAEYYSKNVSGRCFSFKLKNAISIIRFPMMLPNGLLTKEMLRIGIRRMYPNAILDVKAIAPYLKNPQIQTPGASQIAEKLFTLPTHTGIDIDLAKRICSTMNKSSATGHIDREIK